MKKKDSDFVAVSRILIAAGKVIFEITLAAIVTQTSHSFKWCSHMETLETFAVHSSAFKRIGYENKGFPREGVKAIV